MSTLLPKKVAYHVIAPGTVKRQLVEAKAINDALVDDRTLTFRTFADNVASAVLDTVKRAVYPFVGSDPITLPAAGSVEVSTHLGGVAVSAATPLFDNVTRTWTNLGACVYAPDNKVLIRAKGAQGPDATDAVTDAQGREVFGRLTNAGGPNGTWTVTFYVETSPGVEAATTLAAPVDAFLIYKQWVSGSNSLLEDQGRTIVSAPNSIDIGEMNRIETLRQTLGLAALSGDGQVQDPFGDGKTVIQKIQDHLNAVVGARHDSADIDAEDGLVSGLAANSTLSAALAQLQANISAAGGSAATDLALYFDELRSDGVLGESDVLTANGASADVAALTAYVAGKRFSVAATSVTPGAGQTLMVWVDAAGAVQSGAAYPVAPTKFAKLGTVVEDAGAVTVTDEHLALVELDAKVYAIDELVKAHLISTTAHDAADIVFAAGATGLTLADGTTPVANTQQAIEAVVRRFNAVSMGIHSVTLNEGGGGEGDLTLATADAGFGANMAYLEFTLPGGQTYKPGTNTMFVFVDGDETNLGELFTEPANNKVRIYFDTTDPLIADMKIKLRWLNV